MLSRLIAAQNRRNWHPYTFLLFCAFVGLMRGVLEILLQGIVLYNSDIFNFVPFYVLLGLLLTLLLAVCGNIGYQSVQKSLIMGLFMGLFPPLFDFILFQNRYAFYGYYYIWDFTTLPYAGYKPEFNFPAGETLAIWLSIAFCGLYVHTVTRNIFRALAALIGGYAVFIFMGSLLPMLVAKLSGVFLPTIMSAREIDPSTLKALGLRIAFYQSLLALLVYLLIRRDLATHLIRRSLHIAPFAMLTILGGIVVKANPVSLTQSTLLIVGVGIVILVQNDFFDAAQTSQVNTKSVVQKYDVQIVNVLFLLALFPLFMQNNRAAIAAGIAYVCGILYNYPLYRARNHFPANLKIEGVWGLCAFLAGVLLEPNTASRPLVIVIAFLVFGGWSTVAILKDLKDAEEDLRDGVHTLFTLLMRRGYSLPGIWRYVRLIFIGLLAIPLILAAFHMDTGPLAALAAVTGGIAATFWLTNFRRAFQIQLVLLAVYLGCWQYIFAANLFRGY